MIIEEKIPKEAPKEFLTNKILELIQQQENKWKLLKENYESLQSIKTKEFKFNFPSELKHFKVIVQYNPNRIKSTIADVSENAIKNRKCFLCTENLPEEQDGLLYNKNFIILVNPYPIFRNHLTISKNKHTPQSIIGHFQEFINLTEALSQNFTLIYNGPRCGASAPDHMHFQAVKKFSLPIEQDIEIITKQKENYFFENDKIKIYFVENYIRKFILLNSKNKGELLYAFKVFLNSFKKISEPKEEPMINIISTFQNDEWIIIIFPRMKHRPKEFYFEGEEQLLVSPAAIDLGGVIITVREEDFNKINSENIIDIYNQVTLTKEFFEYFKKKFSDVYLKKYS
ncbi:MAG: DUF4922 domain-containing protein [Melioribacter sp.]|nr:DUF4922 domain-containing protein [Melioribacter sp.]